MRGVLLMVASGAAALGYQIVWTQQAALWLGHEAASVLAVITAFFFGIGLGAWLLAPRLQARWRPWRAYALCEAAIGLWALVLAALQAPAASMLRSLIGEQPSPAWHWGVAFTGTTLLLLPATLAMGATLPAMDRVLRAWGGGERLGLLYAANTAGGVIGVLAASLWVMPAWGLARTGWVCAGLNLLVAAVAWRAQGTAQEQGTSPRDAATAETAPTMTPASAAAMATAKAAPNTPPPHRAPLAWLAATGLLGIGHEVVMVRVLSQVAEDTVYTYALLLAVYLAGTALGGAAWQAWARHQPRAPLRRVRLLRAVAAACALSALAAWQAAALHAAVLGWLGAGMVNALAAEAVLAVAAFGLPTLAMGALFTELCTQARAAGNRLGPALGINTLAAAFAPPLFGVVLIPALGLKGALLVLLGGYMVLCLLAPGAREQARPQAQPHMRPQAHASSTLPPSQPARALPFAATACALAAAALLLPPLRHVDLPPGGRIASYRDGVSASVSVTEDADGTLRLRIDNREQEGSSDSLSADARQALLPLLLHPAPRHVLFLGLGTGTTATAAASDPTLQVQAAELLPEVAAAAPLFTQHHFDEATRTRLQVLPADARRFVHASNAGTRYDVVIADNFHPARSGSAALYTVEHFAAVRDRLSEDGLFCQWLPLHQLDLDTLRSIVASFLPVYPQAGALLATHSLQTPVIGLVGRRDGRPFALADVQRRVSDWQGAVTPAQLGLADALPVAGAFVAGPSALHHWAAGAPLNRDDHPRVAWMAPRAAYAPADTPAERLLQWLRQMDVHADELVTADAADTRRLQAWRAARVQFLQAGLHVQPSRDPGRLLAQVREPLLAVLHTSPDFRPAYDPLLAMAHGLAPQDPMAARALLQRLAQQVPGRREAAQALASLR